MKPTTYYPWAATDGETEVIDENGYFGTVPNKAAPDTQFNTRGIFYDESMPSQYWNYLNDGPGKWFAHVDQRLSIGDLYPTTENLTETQIETRLGGDWALLGTTTISATTTYWWKKLA